MRILWIFGKKLVKLLIMRYGSISSMWVLIIIAFFQIGNAYASAPVDLELLLNRGLQSFIASPESMPNTKVSKTSHNDESFTPSLCDEAVAEGEGAWGESLED